MQYTKLGQTDIDISTIALGTWAFSGDNTWGPQDDAASVKTVHAALDCGITFFDTAPLYGDGRAERILGTALQEKPNNAVLATKVAPADLSEQKLRSSLEQSLKLLKRDCIDLYQVHWPSREIPMEETIATLDSLKKEGKIRAVGVSNFGVGDTADWLEKDGEMVTNQLPYSLLWRPLERELGPLCIARSVGILCYSPLCNGLLSGRFPSPASVPDGRARSRLFSHTRPQARHQDEGCEKELFEALDEIRRISAELGEQMVTVSLAWLVHQDGVTSVLAGGRTPDQLAATARAASLTLSPEVQASLDHLTAPVKEHIGTNMDMWQTDSRYR